MKNFKRHPIKLTAWRYTDLGFYMLKYGITPMQAIAAATINGADLLGWKDKVGSIKGGQVVKAASPSASP